MAGALEGDHSFAGAASAMNGGDGLLFDVFEEFILLGRKSVKEKIFFVHFVGKAGDAMEDWANLVDDFLNLEVGGGSFASFEIDVVALEHA